MATSSVDVCNALRKVGIKCGDDYSNDTAWIYVDVSGLEASYVNLPGYNDKGAFEKLKAYMEGHGYEVHSNSGTDERQCGLDANEKDKCKVYIFRGLDINVKDHRFR
jgi:hypothetical protein